MSDPAFLLDALIAQAPARPMPRLTLAQAAVELARLTQPTSAPPVTIAPPRFEPPSLPAPWSNMGGPLPSAPPISIAPPRVEPPSLPPVVSGPPRLIIVSDIPPDAPMFRLSDLEELEELPQAGAAVSEAIAPNTPPPLPSDSISEMISAVAEEVERSKQREEEIIDLDLSSVELVFLED